MSILHSFEIIQQILYPKLNIRLRGNSWENFGKRYTSFLEEQKENSGVDEGNSKVNEKRFDVDERNSESDEKNLDVGKRRSESNEVNTGVDGQSSKVNGQDFEDVDGEKRKFSKQRAILRGLWWGWKKYLE